MEDAAETTYEAANKFKINYLNEALEEKRSFVLGK